MTIKDIVTLAAKGVSIEDIKKIHASENEDDLVELVKTGVSYEDAVELASMAAQQSEDPEPSPPDPAPAEDTEDWKSKYDELLKKTQKEKARENNLNGDEEADRKKRLEDMARRFM